MSIKSLFLILATCVLFASCGTTGDTETGSTKGSIGINSGIASSKSQSFDKNENGKTEDGLVYEITRGGAANTKTVEIGDQLSMHLEYKTAQDSVIYTSKKRNKPIDFKYSETLFRGVINEGLSKMTEGDVGVFKFPASKMYDEKALPKFLTIDTDLVYVVELLEIRKEGERTPVQKVKDAPGKGDTE